jgi:hypothetical protein
VSQGRKELRSVRLRLEATNGAYPASVRYLWRGMAEMPEDQREVVNREELVGIFGGYADTYIPKFMGAITLGETEATFEQLPVLFAAAGFGSAGGSVHGASGSAVSFYMPVPAATVWPTQSFTIEAGEPAQGLGGEAEVGTYCLVNELKLSGAGGEAVKVESQWIARTWERINASGSFGTAGTVVSPVETVLAGRGTVYFDQAVSGAVFGNTAAAAGNVLGFEVTFSEMWEPKFAIDSGQLYFHTAVYKGCVIEGNLTFESQAVGSQSILGTAGLKQQAFRDQIPYLMRLNWPGGTIPVGTTFQNKLLQINLPITATSVEPLDDQNGNSITTLNFFSKAVADVPAAGRGTILVVRRGQQEMI